MKQLFRVLDNDGEGELSVQDVHEHLASPADGDCDSKAMLMATKSLEKAIQNLAVMLTYEKLNGNGAPKAEAPAPSCAARESASLGELLTEIAPRRKLAPWAPKAPRVSKMCVA
eukprot:Skav223171  [mRNA]  locus=scaffold2044:85091:86340:+ [translate_table: standard]